MKTHSPSDRMIDSEKGDLRESVKRGVSEANLFGIDSSTPDPPIKRNKKASKISGAPTAMPTTSNKKEAPRFHPANQQTGSAEGTEMTSVSHASQGASTSGQTTNVQKPEAKRPTSKPEWTSNIKKGAALSRPSSSFSSPIEEYKPRGSAPIATEAERKAHTARMMSQLDAPMGAESRQKNLD